MWREIRDAIRSVWRWRLGAAFAILTLAVGIGGATSLYAFLRTALSTSGSLDDPALARIYESNPARPGERGALSADDAPAVVGDGDGDGPGWPRIPNPHPQSPILLQSSIPQSSIQSS